MAAGQRIEQERIARGWSQARLAKEVTRLGHEISQTGIDKIEKRDSKRPHALPEAAKALGLTESWLRTGKGEKYIVAGEPDVSLSFQRIPLVTWISAGGLMREDLADEMLSDMAIAGLPKGDWIALRVDGDSMDRISPPGSTILVNRKDKRLIANALYVIGDLDGNATYKRYRPGPPPRFEPVSSNKDLEPIFPEHEPLIIGRVRRTILDT